MKEPQILFEDNHLLVVLKPAGYLSQSDGSTAPDLLTRMKTLIKIREQKPGAVYLGLVHRLDRPVAGVMVLAKTSKAASRLSEQIRQNRFQKTYWAVCQGRPEPGIWEDYLLKDGRTNLSRTAQPHEEGAKWARLEQRCLAYEAGLNASLVEIQLHTGRSHQIRVQFASRKHPLLGDRRYGKREATVDLALYARALAFDHPVSKESLHFTAPEPKGQPWSALLERKSL